MDYEKKYKEALERAKEQAIDGYLDAVAVNDIFPELAESEDERINEAPEDIYLLPDDRNPNGLSVCWYEAPYRTGAIEYTRTDAFIEKAEEFIYSALNDGIMGTCDIEDFIRLFKNYMKGE